MEKKFQIFISSTFKDLQLHREAIIKIVLDMGHIPSGMELFSATDMEQFDYIKKVIDQCDYYVLVVAGKYGSLGPDGKSYTQMEYEYAVLTGKVVLAFIVHDVGKLTAELVEVETDRRLLLDSFISVVKTGRIVQFWSGPEDLASKVILALTKAFSQFPQVGWLRADQIADEAAVRSLNDKNIEIESLRKQLSSMPALTLDLGGDQLAGLDDTHKIDFFYDTLSTNERSMANNVAFKWREFAISTLAYMRQQPPMDGSLVVVGFRNLIRSKSKGVDNVFIDDTTKTQLLVQLELLGFIERGSNSTYRMTALGTSFLLSSIAVKAPKATA